MRVLQVSHRYPPEVGGVETHVQRLAAALARQGHDVEVFATGPASVTMDGDVRVRRFPGFAPGGAYHLSLALARAVARGRWDVIHAHNYHALPAFHAFRGRGRTPFVLTGHLHGSGHTPLRRLLHVPYRAAARAMWRDADAVLAVSRAEAERVRAMFGRSALVVPNGVELAEQAREPPAREERTLLSMGRVERYKRVDLAVEALARLPGWRLDIVGDGPDLPRVLALARQRGVAERVRAHGWLPREEALARLRASEVFVSASEHEAFGLGLLEAVAAGCAAVASDIPAHRELAEALGGVVRLAPPEADAFAEAIASSRAPGEAPAAIRRFGWDRIAREVAGAYENATAA